MKLFHNYRFFFIIFFLLIGISVLAYYFLIGFNLEKQTTKEDEISHLNFEIFRLEIENLTKDLELIDIENVSKKLSLAKKNEDKLQRIFLDSLDSDSWREKYKPYSDCTNFLYSTLLETIKLNEERVLITQGLIEIQEKDIKADVLEEKINLYTDKITELSDAVIKTKNKLNDLCVQFDSLNHAINSYIE